MKRIVFLLILSISTGSTVWSQLYSYKVTDQTNTVRKLSVRPNMVFGIDYLTKGFYVGTNVDVQYWHAKLFDARAGLTMGSFNGPTFGGTFHLRDKYVSKNHKFIVSQTETQRVRTTRYFKGEGNVRSIFGPCADFKVGSVGTNDSKVPYFEVLLGVDFQQFSRIYGDTEDASYPSNKNGWFSLKFQGIYGHTQYSNGIGFAGKMDASRRPWKGVTIYLTTQLGVFKVLGGKMQPIISPGFGLSVNLFKSNI